MTIDKLKVKVTDYVKEKDALDARKKEFSGEQEKLKDLQAMKGSLDKSITDSFKGLEDVFRREKGLIDRKTDTLSSIKKDLMNEIREEDRKTSEVKRVADTLAGQRYGRDAKKASDKAQELLDELSAMMDELGDEDSLPANARVRVDGTYYRTDDAGFVHMARGSDGEYHPLPNITYTVHGYTYRTDANGRITHAQGKLSVKDGERAPLNVTVPDMLQGDQRGHIVGDQFNGSNLNDNLVAQLGEVNQGAYRTLEMKLSNLVSGNGPDGKRHEVFCTYDISYEGSGRRPDCISVTYTVDGGLPIPQDFINY